MAAVRLCVVSDSHMSTAAPESLTNWDAVVEYVAATRPDLVVHLGDLALDGTGDDLQHARRQLDRLPVPWRAVPGNHDIGDNPWPGRPDSWAVDADRRQHWVDVIGADRWSLSFGDWTIVAVDAQLFGSELAEEAEQWAWLEDQLAARDDTGPVALVTHKPIAATDDELREAPPYRFVPDDARRRLAGMTSDRPLDLVLSGHVHQHRVLDIDGTRHAWAPSTWAVLPDELQPVLGAKRCGVVTVELGPTAVVEPSLVEPDGVAQLTLGRDIPDPYA